jgi:hypothetical protein
MCTHWNNDRLLKHLSTKLDKYVFDKRIQHLSDLVQFIYIIKFLVTFDKVTLWCFDLTMWCFDLTMWCFDLTMWCFDLTNVVLFGFRFIRKSTSYYIISLYSPDFVSYLYTHLTLYHISILTWLYIISLYSPDFVSYLYTHLTLYHISILTWLYIISLYSPDFISYLYTHLTLYHKVRWV